jgi:hypothetical protein
MPFTLAHPAAAIPLYRVLGRAGVLSALIAGSMSPDLTYFLPFEITRATSHSLTGLFLFCIPLGLVGYVLFHVLLRPPGYYLLPLLLRDRLPRLPSSAWLPVAPLWAVLVSLLVGAATHLVWDAFTHEDGFVVAASPALRTLLWEIGGYRIFPYKGLQHGSTLIGFSLLARWGWQWYISTSVHHEPCDWQPSAVVRVPALFVLLVAPALGGLLSGLWQMGDVTGMKALQQFMGHGIITALSIFGTILLGFGVIWRLWEARRRRSLTTSCG